jgi:DNA polymerase elongation subunit (family B)
MEQQKTSLKTYISAILIGNKVRVWFREENGPRTYEDYPAIFEFYVQSEKGRFTDIYGNKVEKFTFNNYDELRQAASQLKSHGYKIYESDIRPEFKVLGKYFYKKPTGKLNTLFFDIEVDYDPKKGFSSVENPYAPISSVAVHKYWCNKSIVFVVPPPEWDKTNTLDDLAKQTNTEIVFCDNEKQLLLNFLDSIYDADIICGWNSDFFDVPYVLKRIHIVLGEEYETRLCFEGARKPKFRTVEKYKKEMETADLSGRISWDYMELFKKFEMEERQSYSLEAISNEILPELPKLDYEGSLYNLYHNNFVRFVEYNIRDTEILKGFEDKLGYVDTANKLYHLSCGADNQILSTIPLAELAIINFCHHELKRVVPDFDDSKFGQNRKILGATVLNPKKGIQQWIGSVDVSSLYPSSIRCVNISPEKIVGQCRGEFSDDDRAKFTAHEYIVNETDDLVTVEFDKTFDPEESVITKPAKEWAKILRENKWSISGSGTIFDQSKGRGIIPAVLDEWYNMRKQYKKQAAECLEKAQEEKQINGETEKYKQLKERHVYYDKLQYVYKIKMNSLYGALTNEYFKFFDTRLGQSTTGTGRAVLEHMCSKIAELIDGEYRSDSPSIVYGDTDSCYFKTNVEKLGYDFEKTKKCAIKLADYIGKKVNESFPEFCKKAFFVQDEFSHYIKCEREIVGLRGLFVTKKRYVIKVINSDGRDVDKLKVMGLEMKKTTTPPIVQKFLEQLVNDMLGGVATDDEIDERIIEFRDRIADDTREDCFDLLDIGLQKGVQKVEEYTANFVSDPGTRLPGHVAASIHYNLCLELYNDTENPKIVSGSKIKVYYIKNQFERFTSIAIPTDLIKLPFWFNKHCVVDRKKQASKLVDGLVEKLFEPLQRQVPTRQTKLNDLVLEY